MDSLSAIRPNDAGYPPRASRIQSTTTRVGAVRICSCWSSNHSSRDKITSSFDKGRVNAACEGPEAISGSTAAKGVAGLCRGLVRSPKASLWESSSGLGNRRPCISRSFHRLPYWRMSDSMEILRRTRGSRQSQPAAGPHRHRQHRRTRLRAASRT